MQLFQNDSLIDDDYSYRSFNDDDSSSLSRNLVHAKEVYIINGILEKWFGKLAFYCAFYNMEEDAVRNALSDDMLSHDIAIKSVVDLIVAEAVEA